MYEERFGTDWTAIDGREEAVERAFALGVAAKLGERHPGELDRISDAIDSTYDRSFVELAYHEGREKANDVAPDADSDEDIWRELVQEETVIDPNDRPEPSTEESDDGVPDAVRGLDVDTRPDDSTDAVERPSFLDRRSSGSGPDFGGSERTMFGRKKDDVESDASTSADAESESEQGAEEGGDDDTDGGTGDHEE